MNHQGSSQPANGAAERASVGPVAAISDRAAESGGARSRAQAARQAPAEARLPRPRTPCGRAWARCVAPGGIFTSFDIAQAGNVAEATARDWIAAWRADGLLRDLGRGPKRRVLWQLDPEAAAQRAAKPTGVPRPADAEASAFGNLWRAMRRCPTFTPTDIMALANAGGVEVDPATAGAYCRLLYRAGYLKRTSKGKRGISEPRFRLIRNTGPLPPRPRHLPALFDENLERITYALGLDL